MKNILFLLSLVLISTQSFAQLLAQAKPVGSDDWGYINVKGEFVIEPQYRKCNPFATCGFAAIYERKGKEFFFINQNNEKLKTEVNDFELKNIFGFGTVGFVDNMALVRIGKKWGFLDKKGFLSVKAVYDDATVFDNGAALAKRDDKWFVINTVGQEKEIEAELEDAKNFQNGLAPVKVDGQFGYINTEGQLVIEPKFNSVGYFVHGRAWAKANDGQVGLIDQKGNWVVEPIYDAAKDPSVSTGLVRVRKDGNWMFIDKKNEVVKMPTADTYGEFEDGLAYAKKDDLVGFVSPNGSWAIEPQFDKVRDFKNGYAAALKGDKWGFIDKSGNWVIEPQFDGVRDFESSK